MGFDLMMSELGRFDLILVGWTTNGHRTAKFMLGAMDALGKAENNSPVVVTDNSVKKLHAKHKTEALRMGAAGYVSNLKSLFEEIPHVLEMPSPPEPYEKTLCAVL